MLLCVVCVSIKKQTPGGGVHHIVLKNTATKTKSELRRVMKATEALKVLGIERVFPISEETIKKQYRVKAKECHPDISGSDDLMIKVNEAYEWLTDNLGKVNKANEPKVNTYSQKTIEALKATEIFCKLYLAETDNDKRVKLIDDLDNILERYKFERKLASFKEIMRNN